MSVWFWLKGKRLPFTLKTKSGGFAELECQSLDISWFYNLPAII